MPCYGPTLFPSYTGVSGCTIPLGFYLPMGPTPPSSFFDIRGIYGQRFGPMVATFNQLFALQVAANPTLTTDPFNNRFSANPVTTMNFKTQQIYENQLRLFRKVYDYNYVAYYTMANKNIHGNPQYYRFQSASELSEFRAAAALVNKMYNVNENYPVACIFFLPFPPFCNDT